MFNPLEYIRRIAQARSHVSSALLSQLPLTHQELLPASRQASAGGEWRGF
jgi:hypothetical protein